MLQLQGLGDKLELRNCDRETIKYWKCKKILEIIIYGLLGPCRNLKSVVWLLKARILSLNSA